jgi:rubrerythrin
MSFSPKVRYFTQAAVALFALVGLGVGISSSAKAAETMTSNLQVPQKISPALKRLQAAYNDESNVRVHYLAFANRAKQEGYGRIASLFHAMARAEEVHQRNHAQLIRQLGATPQAKIEVPAVQSTPQNLASSISGESSVQQTLYTPLIEQARQGKNVQAIRLFSAAQNSESQHEKLFQQALNNPRLSNTTFYVCSSSGYVSPNPNAFTAGNCSASGILSERI